MITVSQMRKKTIIPQPNNHNTIILINHIFQFNNIMVMINSIIKIYNIIHHFNNKIRIKIIIKILLLIEDQ